MRETHVHIQDDKTLQFAEELIFELFKDQDGVEGPRVNYNSRGR